MQGRVPYPPADVCAAAGSGGMRASRPTDAWVAAAVPVWRVVFGRFVGEGFIPPGDLPVQQGSRDDASIVPYMGLRCDKVAVSRLVVYPTIDRRGGFHIRPQTLAPPRGAAG